MTYAVTNPPQKLAGNGPSGGQLWYYVHTDVHTDVDATDYFTNGDALGMKVNDVVMVCKSDATKGVTIHLVTVVTAGGAATVAAAILA